LADLCATSRSPHSSDQKLSHHSSICALTESQSFHNTHKWAKRSKLDPALAEFDDGPSLLARHQGTLDRTCRAAAGASLHKQLEASSSRRNAHQGAVGLCLRYIYCPKVCTESQTTPAEHYLHTRFVTTFLELLQSDTWDPSKVNRRPSTVNRHCCTSHQEKSRHILSEEGVA
jgi:hypothetical protein